MSLPLSLLRERLDSVERYEAKVSSLLTAKDTELCNLEAQISVLQAQLLTVKKEQELLKQEHTKATDTITELRVSVATAQPPPPPSPPSPPKIWSVSDCHSHFLASGAWALEATESGSYGVCISSSHNEGSNVDINLHNGERVLVSSRRLNAVAGIRTGDIFFMGDTKRDAVFKGVVTGQPVKGFFKSEDASLPSLRRRASARAEAMNKPPYRVRNLAEEVEIVWSVNWECVGKLTDEWKKYLCYSQQRSVRPLQSLPTL